MNTKLKELRLNKNITSKKMAELLNISKAYYCQLENFKRKLSYPMAFKIALIFKMKPDDIFYDEFEKRM